jgi:hypothetical protein
MNRRAGHLSRRELMKGALAAEAAMIAGCASHPSPKPPLIQTENSHLGTRDWMLTTTRIDPKTKYRCPWIEGYCSHTSIKAGDTLSIFVSTNPPAQFTLDIYRMGSYQGLGGKQVMRVPPIQGKVQDDPPVGERRLRNCQWEPSVTLQIPRNWRSGVYVGKLTEQNEGIQSYVIFIVRDDRKADLIFQCSDTTWQAYNRWPNQFSLYDDGKSVWYWGPGVDVSFNRPYGKYCQILDAPLSIGSGEFFLWEFPLCFWLEQQGYDVTYISNLDTHNDPKNLLRAKGILSVGHDEYYSIEMFNHMKAAIAAGVNVAFLSGNTCCGRIEYSPGRRSFTRADRYGPRDEEEIKAFPAMALLPWKSPNENTLIGARSTGPITGGADWVCTMPEHWLYEGSGMKKGEGIPGLIGWEWHGDPAAIPGLEIIASAPTRSGNKIQGTYTATIYPGPKENIVFNASSCWFADGLSAPPGYLHPTAYTTPRGPDARAQKMTTNLLKRMLA